MRSLKGLQIVNQLLSYPYKDPHIWFDHEISQLETTGILTISPFGYFVTKPPLTLIPHKELETTGLQ